MIWSKKTLSLEEMIALRSKLDTDIAELGTIELEAMKAKLNAIAQAQGVDVVDLLKEPPKERKKREVPIRYRDPENPDNVWRGLGKPARWLQAKLDAGHHLEEFAVQ